MNILINNVNLLEPAKKKLFLGSVVIVNNKIIEISQGDSSVPSEKFDKIIDGQGYILLPGFIDSHSRADLAMISDPTRLSAVSQGFTLEVIGQDGFSVAPVSSRNYMIHHDHVLSSLGNPQIKWRWSSVSEYLEILHNKIATNILYYIPLGTMNLEARDPGTLKYIFEKAYDEGSIGLSCNLNHLDSESLKTLLPLLKTRDAVLNVNMSCLNSVDADISKDLEKGFAVAKEYGLRLHFSRICSNISGNWDPIISILEKRKKDVKDLLVDLSPYKSRVIKFSSLMPKRIRHLSQEELKQELSDPKKLRALLFDLDSSPYDFSRLVLLVTSLPELIDLEGLSFGAISEKKQISIQELIHKILYDDYEKVYVENYIVEEKVLEKLFSLPFVVPATTGLSDGRPVPDIFGTVPAFYGQFSKEGAVTLSSKLATTPASFFRLNWGIKKGSDANLVMLDLDKLFSDADALKPRKETRGIDMVCVNGKIVYFNENVTGNRAGQVLSWI